MIGRSPYLEDNEPLGVVCSTNIIDEGKVLASIIILEISEAGKKYDITV